MIFRAIWPITDEGLSYAALCMLAKSDLPLLIGQAHARLTSPGRFSIAPSNRVPGSGRITESVLVFEAPAIAVARRDYWKASA